MSVYEQLKRAREARDTADMEVRKAQMAVANFEDALMAALPIDAKRPCAIALLPNGQFAVHILTPRSSTYHELHVLTATDIPFTDTILEGSKTNEQCLDRYSDRPARGSA